MKTKSISFAISLLSHLFVFSQSDACSGAENLPVNASCSSQNFNVLGTFTDVGLVNASCVSNSDKEDGWYTIVATSTSTTIEAVANKRLVLAAFTSCTAGELACSNVASGVTASIVFATTIGNTYYIQLHRRSGGSNSDMTGTICAYQTPPSPVNDDPCSATALTVNINCSYSTFTNTSATASSGVADPGCANYLGGDVWFTAVIPSSGRLGINSMTDVVTNGGMAVYYGTCSSLTLISCDDLSSPNSGDMPLIVVSTRPVGSTVYIRFWEYGNDGNGSFKLCASEVNACGNDNTNDYCSNPATLTQGSGSWSSSTSTTYSPDRPGNMGSLFCGGTATIENNSWYRFTASNTTEVFDFTSVSNCLNNKGIQAEVFEVTNDGSSCCTAFTSKSNYYNPGSTSLGTVTATGLTVSNTYILMVDGFAGDQCDFTVSNWTAIGILAPTLLSIKMVAFYGISGTEGNQLYWETFSEKNNDYFIVERSFDGFEFEEIGKVKGNGNSNQIIHYSFSDKTNKTGIIYYRITDVDFDGIRENSNIISLEKQTDKKGIISIYPNPTKDILYVDVNTDNYQNYEEIVIVNEVGYIIQTEKVYSPELTTIPIQIERLENGFYFIYLTGEDFQNQPMKRFIKR